MTLKEKWTNCGKFMQSNATEKLRLTYYNNMQ